MAVAVCHRLYLRSFSRLSRQAGALQPQRSYARSYKQPREEITEYAQFRREVGRLRREFLAEWREGQRMELEAMGAQAAEQAREERRQEELALEENRMELERMAQKRYTIVYSVV